MIRYLKQYKFLLFLTVLFTAISSLSYVFIAILQTNFLLNKDCRYINTPISAK